MQAGGIFGRVAGAADDGQVTYSANAIVANRADNYAAFAILSTEILADNSIVANTGLGVAPTTAVRTGGLYNYPRAPRLTGNNIFANATTFAFSNDNPYDAPDLDLENNWWGTATEAEIMALIHDFGEDATKGYADYTPWAAAPLTAPPIAPPADLVAAIAGATVTLVEGGQSVATDAAGLYSLGNISYSGTGTLTIEMPGFETVTIDNLQVAAGEVLALGDTVLLPPDLTDFYTRQQLDQAVADVQAAKDVIIAERDNTITQLNATVATMYTGEQVDQALAELRQTWDVDLDGKIGLADIIHYLQQLAGIRPAP